MTWRNRYNQSEVCKNEISKELMPVVWHPARWWGWCTSEDVKKEIEQFLMDEK